MYDDYLTQIAADISTKSAVLFLGSGFSRSCRSKGSPDGLPTASGLRDILSKKLEIDGSSYSLEDLSEHFGIVKGQPALYETLADHFVVTETGPRMADFIGLPWWRIYTTNFDDAAEKCLTSLQIQPITMDLDHDANKQIPRNSVIHLNGAISITNAGNLSGKIRLTASTYWDERIRESGWLQRFHRDISQAKCVVFVGYSLFDADVAKLLRANPELSSKTYFIEAPSKDVVKDTKLRPYGTVIHSGFERAAETILEVTPTLTPLEDIYFTSFEEITPPTAIREFDAEAARKFLTIGAGLEDVVFLESNARRALACDREGCEAMLEEVKRGAARHLVVGKIGNGKTVATFLFAARLRGEGYRVFKFVRRTERMSTEIAAIAAMGRACIIVENGFGHTEQLQMICENAGKSVVVVSTARTSAFDLRGSEMRTLMGSEYRRYSVDTLRSSERNQLADALQKLGFFGKYSGKEQRLPDLIDTWGNDVRSLVLKLFEENDVGRVFREQIQKLDDKDARDILVLYFLLIVADARADVETTDDLLSISTYPIVEKYSELFRDFFDLHDGDKIEARSSVVGEFCLKKIFKGNEIVDVLIRVADQQKGKTYADDEAWPILLQFMRFGFIEPWLGASDKPVLLKRYYERLRSNSFYLRNPHFWLQYAIAMMSIGNYDFAKTYLENARSRADRTPRYNYRHLDNHTARYYLESRARDPRDLRDYFAVFLKATSTLISEFKTENQANYTARVCKYLAEFCHRANPTFSTSDRAEAVRRVELLLSHLKSRRGKDQEGLLNDAVNATEQALMILNGGYVANPLRGNDNDFVQTD
ncbi:SIR2 family protein [Rhizobium sp. NPDC090275]|uniref:SIR2 family protein n=1 Tax=Rhizobium sp. NPDC090275 TaxID=3364498 RepID=UPI00383B0505